jgi:hypothetical protein
MGGTPSLPADVALFLLILLGIGIYASEKKIKESKKIIFVALAAIAVLLKIVLGGH